MIFMERVNRLMVSPAYREHLETIEKKEADRVFCKHDFAHCLEVARLCWIFLLENGIDYSRDVVYSAALLHDIGRWMEYDGGGCHAGLGARLADPLLVHAGYSWEERKLITDAIAEHRKKKHEVFTSSLSYYLRKADKYSRLCYDCPAGEACYKKDDMPQGRLLLY